MKLGLLSYHNAANYGAALQAFALQKALEQMGFESEYINYQNHHRKNSYNMTFHIITALKKRDMKSAIRFLLGSPFMMLRKLKFNSFYSENLTTTSQIYSSSDEAKRLNGAYSKFIVGSDQVWNWENNGGDATFLLSFVEADDMKISYSSSFGIAEIPEDKKSIYQQYLSRFSFLSVREQHGVELVKSLTNRDAVLVLDPVFLLTKEQWLQVSDKKEIRERFVFSYTNKPNQFEGFLFSTNYDIQDSFLYKLSRNVKLSDFIHRKVRVKYSISPSKFLSIIRDAELIVTASFHCVAISIIMNKPFVAILTGDKGKDERLLSILSLLGLENRILTDQMTQDIVNEPINYDLVNNKIEIMKSSSVKFLLNAIRN
ncbi:MAG: polysaccharide pyruvyl transferase family protein [Bacteroidales bacterium]|nr:polysaccharide pyruvyl transferase family protein [Bacteroidales bacterium]